MSSPATRTAPTPGADTDDEDASNLRVTHYGSGDDIANIIINEGDFTPLDEFTTDLGGVNAKIANGVTLQMQTDGAFRLIMPATDAYEALTAGQSREHDFAYRIADMGSPAKTDDGVLTITITEINDAPVLTAKTSSDEAVVDTQLFEYGRDTGDEGIADAAGIGGWTYSDVDTGDTALSADGANGGFIEATAGDGASDTDWMGPSDALNGGKGRSITGTYGVLFFKADGSWTYELDNECGAEADDPGCDTAALVNGENAEDGFAFRVDDGSANTAGRYSEVVKLAIKIGGGSDRPTATPVAQTVAVNNYLRFEESDTAFGFADEDLSTNGNGMFWGVMISELPGTGALYNAGTAVEATDVIEVANLDDLVYVPAACTTLPTTPCTDSFKYHVRDNGNAVTASDRPGPDREGPWLFSTEDKTLNDVGAPKPVAVTPATMSISVTAAASLSTVSISDLNFPTAIIEGTTARVTFVRSGSIVDPLQAYAQVTSSARSSDIDLSLMFPRGEAVFVADVSIPENSLSANSFATLGVLSLTGTPSDLLSKTPHPDFYEVGTGDAVSRTFALTNVAPTANTAPSIAVSSGGDTAVTEAGALANAGTGAPAANGGFDVTDASGDTHTFEGRMSDTSVWVTGTGDSATDGATIAGTYGELKLQLDGDWNYTLDNECGGTYGHQGVTADATEAGDPGCVTERLNGDSGYDGAEHFIFRTKDQDDLYSNVVRVSITIDGANDNPVTADVPAVQVTGSYTFSLDDFSFSDTDDGRTGAGQFKQVEIAELPTAGTLALSGTDVAADDKVLVAAIEAGNLTYTAAANAVNGATATFKFKVDDDTAGGTPLQSAEATFNLTINTLPVVTVTNIPASVTEGGAAGVFTFMRTGPTTAALEAAANLTYEGNQTESILWGKIDFAIGSPTATASWAIVPFSLKKTSFGTLRVATPAEAEAQQVSNPGEGLMPGMYATGTGAGLSRPVLLLDSTMAPNTNAPTAADDAVATDESVVSVTGNVITGPTATHPGLGADFDRDLAGAVALTQYAVGSDISVRPENASTTQSATIITGTYGTLTMAADGSFTYTLSAAVQALDAGDMPTDTFIYEVEETTTGTTPGPAKDTAGLVFTIAGLNDAPTLADNTAAPGANKTLKEAGMTSSADSSAQGALTFMDDDADDSALGTDNTFQATAGDGSSTGSSTAWMVPSDTDNGGKGRGVSGTYGTLFFKANGTWTYALDDANTAVQALADGVMAMDSFAFRLDDGATITDSTRYSNTVALTLEIAGTSDIPTASPTRQPISMNNVLKFAGEDFGFEDVDSGVDGEFREVRIQSLPTPNGTLLYRGQPVVAGTTRVPVAMLDELTFVPGASMTPSFTFQVRDNRAAGGLYSATATMNIDVIMNASLPDVSISATGFPSSITEGMSAMVTFARTMPHTDALQAYAQISGTGVKRAVPFSVLFAEGAGTVTVGVTLPQNSIIANGTFTLEVISPAVAVNQDPAPDIYAVAGTDGSRSFMGVNVDGSNNQPTLAAATGSDTDVQEPGGVNNASDTGNLTAAGSVEVSDTDVVDGHTFQATLHQGSSPTIRWQDPVDAANIDKGTRLAGEYGDLFFKSDGSWTYELNVTCIAAGDQGCTTHALHEGTNGDGTDEFAFRACDDSGATNRCSTALDVDIAVEGNNDNPTTVAFAIAVAPSAFYDFKASDFAFMDEDDPSAVEGQYTFMRIGELNTTCGTMTDERGLNEDGSGTRARNLGTNNSFTVTEGGARPIEKMRFTAGVTTPCETTFPFAVLDNTPAPALASPFTNITINVLSNTLPVVGNDSFTVTEDRTASVTGNLITATGLTSGVTGTLMADTDSDAGQTPTVRRFGFGSTKSDLTTNAGMTLSNAAGDHGTMRINTDGSFTYTVDMALHDALAAGGMATETWVYQVTDSFSTALGTITITIRGANDAPTSDPADDLTTAANIDHIFSADDFSFDDPDTGGTLNHITITTLPSATHGTLRHGNPLAATALGADISKANLDAGRFVFRPNTSGAGNTAEIGYTVSDGTADSIAYTLEIDIVAANAPPGATPVPPTGLDEEDTHTFTALNIGFSDGDVGDMLVSVTITSLPVVVGDTSTSAGELRVSDTPLAAGDLPNTIARVDIGNLVFHPVNRTSGYSASFNYTVSDGVTSSNSTAMIIVVGADNDAPVLTAVTSADANVVDTALVEEGRDSGEERGADATGIGAWMYEDSDVEDTALSADGAGGGVIQATTRDTTDTIVDAWQSPMDTLNTGKGRSITGRYGVLFFKADGSWTYELDNDDPDTQALINAQSGTERFAFRVDDGSANTTGRFSENALLNIEILGNSDRPTTTPVPQTVAVNRFLRFAESVFGFADEDLSTDVNGMFWGVMISELPGTGTLYNAGTAVAATNLIEVADLDDLVYVPGECATPPCMDSFKYHVRDNGTAVTATDRPGPLSEGPWLFSNEDKDLDPTNFTAATMPITITATDATVPTLAIAGNSPTEINEGSTATMLFTQTGTGALQAYARVTSASLTEDIDLSIVFAEGSGTAMASLTIPANILTTDGTATLTLLSTFQALDKNPEPSIYGLASTPTATLTLKNVTGTITNRAPVAVMDPMTITEDATITVLSTDTVNRLLSNDTDADGDDLTITKYQKGTTITTAAVNPSVAGTTTMVTGDYGVLVVMADGSYTYTPNDAAHALDAGDTEVTDTFAYQINDGTVDAASPGTLVITITALNDAPVLAAITSSDTDVVDTVLFENGRDTGDEEIADATGIGGWTYTDADEDDTAPLTADGASGGFIQAAATDTSGTVVDAWQSPDDSMNGGKGRSITGRYGVLFFKVDGSWTYELDNECGDRGRRPWLRDRGLDQRPE